MKQKQWCIALLYHKKWVPLLLVNILNHYFIISCLLCIRLIVPVLHILITSTQHLFCKSYFLSWHKTLYQRCSPLKLYLYCMGPSPSSHNCCHLRRRERGLGGGTSTISCWDSELLSSLFRLPTSWPNTLWPSSRPPSRAPGWIPLETAVTPVLFNLVFCIATRL